MSADVLRICGFFQLPETIAHEQDFSTLIRAISEKIPALEETVASKVVLEVELAQVKRNSEKRIQTVQHDLVEAQQKVEALSREVITATQSSHNVSTSDNLSKDAAAIRDLKLSIKELSQQKEHALALFDRQSQALAQRELDIQAANGRILDLQGSLAKIEHEKRQANANQVDAEYHVQITKQELDFTRKHSDWLNKELEKSVQEVVTARQQHSQAQTLSQNELDKCRSQCDTLSEKDTASRQLVRDLEDRLKRKGDTIQTLTIEHTQREEDFAKELSTQVRLVKLWENSAEDAKARISQLEEVAISAQEHAHKTEELQAQNEQLRQDVSRLEDEVINLRSASHHVVQPVSDLSQLNGISNISTDTLSQQGLDGISMAQLYAAFEAEKRNVVFEQRRNARVQKSFDDLIQELESRAPQIQEQREEFSALQHEVMVLSQQLQTAQDKAEELEAEHSSQIIKVSDHERTIELQARTLKDLARQVQRLLFELEEQGFSAAPLSEMEITALNRMLDEPQTDTAGVQGVISNRLVLFKSIQDLQKQNEQLLRVSRDLGDKLERSERATEGQPLHTDERTFSEAQQTIEKLTQSLRNAQAKMQLLERERDLMKNMLPSGTSRSLEALSPATASSQHESALAQQLATHQREANVNQKILDEQLSELRKERLDLTTRLARSTAQLELGEERITLLNANLTSVRKEAGDIRVRYQEAQDRLTANEVKYQNLADSLLETRSLLNAANAGSSNLRAEMELYKSIEARTLEELKSVRQERDRLGSRVATMQALSEEHKVSSQTIIARSEAQIAQLTNELQQARNAIAEERQEVRRLTIGREAYTADTQIKLQASGQHMTQMTAQLAAVSAERDSASARIADLEKQVASHVRRLEVFEQSHKSQSTTTELRRKAVDLDDARTEVEEIKEDLRQARAEAERLQDLAHHAETELQQFQLAHEAFIASAEEQLKTRADEIVKVRQERADLETKNLKLQSQLDNSQTIDRQRADALSEQLSHSAQELASIREQQKQSDMVRTYLQEDLRTQADIAQEAQQNYESELLKHAEAAQALRALREDYTVLRTELVTLQKDHSLAEASLMNSARSWEEQKSLYERELTEMRAALHDLQQQNTLLHEQFDKIVVGRDMEGSSDMVDTTTSDSVQTILQFVRREKDILEVKHEILQQENKRQSHQLAATRKAAEDAMTALQVETENNFQALKNAQSDATDLKESLEMLRGSNKTLRSEHAAQEVRIRALEKEIAAYVAQIEPLQAQVRLLEADLESLKSDNDLLRQDNDRWKKRNQAILQKYDRIDPEELQELRLALTAAKQSFEQAQVTIAELQKSSEEQKIQLDNAQKEVLARQTMFDNLRVQSKERIGKERKDAKQAKAENESLLAQIATLQQQLASTENSARQTQNDAAEASQRNALETEVERLQQALTSKESELDAVRSELQKEGVEEIMADGEHDIQTLQVSLMQAQSEAADLQSRLDQLQQDAKHEQDEAQQLKARIEELEADIAMQESSESTRPNDVFDNTLNDNEAAQAQQALIEQVKTAKDQEKLEALARQAEELEAQALLRIEEARSQLPAGADQSTNNVATSQDDALEAERARHQEELDSLKSQIEQQALTKARQLNRERIDAMVEQRLAKKVEAAKKEWLAEQPERDTEAPAQNLQQALLDKEAEFEKRLAAKEESVKKEVSMRNTLLQKKLEKQIETLTAQLKEKETIANESDQGKFLPSSDEVSEREDTPAATAARPAKRGRGRGRGGLKRTREDAAESDAPAKKTAV